MKNNLVKRLCAVALAATMVLGMVGCGSSASTTTESTTEENTETDGSEEVVLNVWHQWANDTNELKGIYDAAVAAYMEEHPNVTINTETLDTEAYKTKISAEFAGDASGIDVFYYWGAGTAKKLVDAGKLLSLDDYITEEVAAKILPGSTSAFEYDGSTYSLPSFSWYMALFCNTALFEEAGVELPTTYDELLAAVEALTEIGVTPIASGAKDGWNAAFVYQALAMREIGADTINSMLSGETAFAGDDGYRAAAEKMSELYELGAFGANPLEGGNDDANASFIAGNSAMRIMGSWFANQVYSDETVTINPEDVVAINIPMINEDGDASDYCGGFIESFWVNNSTANPDVAADFAIYINEKMGAAAYETGTGFSGWDVEMDDSNLNPLFIQIKELLAESETGVLAWDTSLDSYPATIHNEMVQTLFAPNADIDAFIEEHEMAINE
ncbi:MAG: extracellular solute-binding protein [Eubacteriales bacterium]